VSVERLLRENGARVVVIRKDYTIFETTGHREETDALINILQPYGLIEFVRSARVAIIKDSEGFNAKLREFERLEPGEDVMENEYLNDAAKVFSM
jgi:acetolactate synthase-1/3 small subunit